MTSTRYVGLVVATLALLGASAFAQTAPLDQGAGQFDALSENFGEAQDDKQSRLDQVRDIATACFSACHGQETLALDASIPSIAGQKFAYIRKQLELFNQHNPDPEAISVHHWTVWFRSNVYMDDVAAGVRDDMYANIAQAISKMPCVSQRPGGAPKQLPPPAALVKCSTCHGEGGLGEAFDIPILAGQSETYLRNQIAAMRGNSKRVAQDGAASYRYHPSMTDKVHGLTDADFDDLAKYFASRDCRGVQ